MRRFAFATSDGIPVELITIGAGRYRANVLSFGATIADLTVPVGSESRSVVLGFADLADYAAYKGHMGAIAGRCANRIAGGRFELDGKTYQLPRNERDRTHLHGGSNGFGRRVWAIDTVHDDRVALSIASPNGEEGYPGAVRTQCSYNIDAGGVLQIELTATTDAPTLVNLATHSYFNLGQTGTILDHRLTVAAERYTPIDVDLIPTGEIASVEGTAFDFRKPCRIGERRTLSANGIDHNFVLAMHPSDHVRFAARLEPAEADLALEIWSTEPGLQVYDGQYLPAPQILRGRKSEQFGGCCLEPQKFPDGINHPGFPGTVLRPGDRYRQVTEYRFFS